MESQPRMRANIIPIADGKSRQAGVFELTGKHMTVRELDDICNTQNREMNDPELKYCL